MNIEKEYKLLVSMEQFFNLVQIMQPTEFIRQDNRYFDTVDNKLKNEKKAMRIRTRKGQNIFTLKVPNQNGDLDEFECLCKKSNLSELTENNDIIELLNKYSITGNLKEIANITTYRAKKVTDEYELCFDINIYNNTIDFEIEYEYKKNHDGFTNFNNILKKANLAYHKNCFSKIKRAIDNS